MLVFLKSSLGTPHLRTAPSWIYTQQQKSSKGREVQGQKEAAWDLILLERVSLAFLTLGLVTEIAPDRGQVA